MFPEKLAQFDSIVNELSKNENSLKVIFDNVNCRFLAASDSFESLTGYSLEEFKKYNIALYLKAFTFDHFFAPLIISKWAFTVYNQMETVKNVNFWDLRITVCGYKVKRKDGQIRRAILRFLPIEMGENGKVKLYVVTGDDITHLMKSDSYWGRMSYGRDSNYTFSYNSIGKKAQPKDILSDREMEVLSLIGEGFESKEIGTKLFMSSHTVDNHRRNAITRMGVKDTTAAIQICRMCGIS
jgi:DNA-binding CsgD family transcriptional regulator